MDTVLGDTANIELATKDVLEEVIGYYKSKGSVSVTTKGKVKKEGVTIHITEEAFIIPRHKQRTV